jgi:small redox-active disulfide protein 2
MPDIKVLILGAGCTKCKTLEERVRAVATAHQLPVEVAKVTDLQEIMNYGVLMTPGLIIAGEVKSVGTIPKDEQLLGWLKGASS